jgi:hypothetical protein
LRRRKDWKTGKKGNEGPGLKQEAPILFPDEANAYPGRPLDNTSIAGKLHAMMDVSDLRERLNQFLHRQNVRKLTPEEREMAKQWCIDVIRREHPKFTDEQVEAYYENLINVRVTAVDEWTQRMEGTS